MYDLETIHRMNNDAMLRADVQTALDDGKVVVAEHDGLHLIEVHVHDTLVQAQQRVEQINRSHPGRYGRIHQRGN